jgi:hypothetical protein
LRLGAWSLIFYEGALLQEKELDSPPPDSLLKAAKKPKYLHFLPDYMKKIIDSSLVLE